MKKFGFTLAEVLITLAIIGIVAALTIPTLVTKYQKKVHVAQLQKVYSSLANAAKMVMADEQVDNLNNTYLRMPDDYNDELAETTANKFLNKYFKVVKTCNKDNITECTAENYKSIDGSDYTGFWGCCGILTNSAVICLRPFEYYYPMTILIDVNGKKGPNVWGRDAFSFDMNYRGELAESFSKESDMIERHKPENCSQNSQEYGFGCLNKIIQDGWKMDY